MGNGILWVVDFTGSQPGLPRPPEYGSNIGLWQRIPQGLSSLILPGF